MTRVYIDGKFYPEEHARISVFDHGFLYGDGIFETLRSYTGRIFRLDDHLTRLFESARAISLALPWSRQQLTAILMETMTVNKWEDGVLRLSVSRGSGPPGLDPALCETPTVVVMARSFQGYPETLYEKGIHISLVEIRKSHTDTLDPRIKSTNFLNNILAKIQAKETGADEGILLNTEGYLTEGTVSNLFFVREGRLYTPCLATGILAGVSRKVVLEIARDEQIPFEEGAYLPSLLESADEVFLTNTTYEVMPVGRLGERTLQVGPLTRRLRQAFRGVVQRG
jgi:branched-chain amino acid aminotransferase